MLTELPDLQESNESLWGCAEVSFTIDTRSKENDEIIERKYTFSHAPEWDKWMFSEFEERRVDRSVPITKRNWRRTRHVMWHENESPDIEIPGEVEQELSEMLDLEEMTIQTP